MSIILVTGGNRGIGLATVEILGSPNARCYDPDRLQGITAKLEALEITITDDSSIHAAVKSVEEKYGKLDVLVNNAGGVSIPKSDDFADIRTSWPQTLDCFVTSQVLVTKGFLPLLRKSDWGRVIMVSSARGSLGRNKGFEMYNCSKAALNLATIDFQNTELKQVEREEDRITFWATSPGYC
ncbi:hypothetical protein F5Y16DRAFT_393412 [Xylariaceae sp. FL0255]|nr:hypothetical protein F5Y16DRAFT_393412 [Xylariaceae sp. FL0255]